MNPSEDIKLVRGEKGWWICECSYASRNTAKAAGFWWNFGPYPKQWSCNRIENAFLLRDFATAEDKAYLEDAMTTRKTNLDASRATDAEVSIPAPEGLEYLPFQKAGIAYALKRNSTLIGDEMGLGKTIQAIGVINATNPKSVLIICPASLRLNWRNEMQKWLVTPRNIYIVNNNDPLPETAETVIVNYDRLSVPGLLDRKWDLLIVDECHKCKNPKALRTQRVLGFYDSKKKVKVEGLSDHSDRKIFLTGTPVLNKPIELWPLVSALGGDTFNSFWSFAKRYCDAVQTEYGWDMNGAKNLEELQIKLRTSIMVRRLKKDVLTELPPKRRQLVVLPTNGSAAAVEAENTAWSRHEAVLADAREAVELAKETGDTELYKTAVLALTQATSTAFQDISKVRHETVLAKLPAFTSYVEDVLESEKKVVVFCHHKDVAHTLAASLSAYSPVVVDGDLAVDKRQGLVDTFQNDDNCRIFIGTIMAAGVGFTLTASSTVLFAELDWVPANVSQAEDRCHRIGQTLPVNITHVVLDGSLDQRMAEVLIAKQDMADKALDKGAIVDLEKKVPAIPGNNRGINGFQNEKPLPETFSKETKAKALKGIKYLAGVCDFAQTRDGHGFNGFDAPIGHSLAACDSLSDKQTAIALKLCRKYKGQLIKVFGDDYDSLYNEAKKEVK